MHATKLPVTNVTIVNIQEKEKFDQLIAFLRKKRAEKKEPISVNPHKHKQSWCQISQRDVFPPLRKNSLKIHMNNQSFLRFSEEISNFSETTHLPEPFHTKNHYFHGQHPSPRSVNSCCFGATQRGSVISAATQRCRLTSNGRNKRALQVCIMHSVLSAGFCWL